MKPIFTGYTAGKAQGTDMQCSTIILIVSFSILTCLIFAVVNYLHGHIWLAVVVFFAAVVLTPCFLLIYRETYLALAKNIIMVDATIVFLALFIDGGIAGAAFMWSLLFPFLACLFMGLPKAWYWILGYLMLIAGAVAAHFAALITMPYPELLFSFFPTAFLFFALIAAIFEMYFERLHIRYEQSISDLQDLQAHLEENVQQRTYEIEQSNHKLKDEILQHEATAKALSDSEERFYQAQKMETIGTLVGGIAHDFNNMLAGINANLFMIKRKGNPSPETLRRIESVGDLVMSASDMIRQLLTFARKDKVNFQYFNLMPFLKEGGLKV